MSSDTRFVVALLAALLVLVGASGVGALAWMGSRDLMMARVSEAQVEAELDALAAEQGALAARLVREPGVDPEALATPREDVARAHTPEAKIAAIGRLSAAMSRSLSRRPAPTTEAEQEALTKARFEIVRAQERALALQEQVEGMRARTAEVEGSLGGRVAQGLGL